MSEITSDKRYNSILKIIDEHLLPDDTAKKERGEVFTPPELVREMLFGLKKSALDKGVSEIWGLDKNGNFIDDNESDKIGGIPTDIWQNPDSTFLDPANGIGNFPIIAFYKLDYELKKRPKFKDSAKRKKHIIEKMLFMIEIDKGNCQTTRAIFKKICPEAKTNICCRDTLTVTDKILEDTFEINRFTVIMGNPPFQELAEDGKTKGGKLKLYQKIILKCLPMLKNNGYINMVIPDNLFSGNAVTGYSKLIENDIQFININNISKKYFPQIGQTTLCFNMQNKKYNNSTIILDNTNQLSRITLEDISLNPLIFWNSKTNNLFKKIICRHQNHCSIDIKYFKSKLSEIKYSKKNIGKYKVMVNPDDILSTNNIDVAFLLNKPKLIIFRNKDVPAFLDSKGEYGVAGEIYYYIDDKIINLYNLKVFFDSKIFYCIRKLTTTSAYLKNPKDLNLSSLLNLKRRINEKDLFSLLSLKETDIDSIKSHFISNKKQKIKTAKATNGGSYNKTRKNIK